MVSTKDFGLEPRNKILESEPCQDAVNGCAMRRQSPIREARHWRTYEIDIQSSIHSYGFICIVDAHGAGSIYERDPFWNRFRSSR